MKLKDNCGSDEDDSISGTPNWSTLTYKIPIYSATYPRLTDFAVAPEVIALKGASTSSDIWWTLCCFLHSTLVLMILYPVRSLGCTLIELVSGKPPYADLIPMSAMFRIVEDDYPPLPDNVSDNMRDFLIRCFQKDPSKRPSAAELKTHLWIQQHDKKNRPNVASARESVTTAETCQPHLQEPVTIENEKNLQYPRIYYNIIPDENSHQCPTGRSSSGATDRDWSRNAHEANQYGITQGLHCFTLTSFGSQRKCKCSHALCETNVLTLNIFFLVNNVVDIECKVCKGLMYDGGILCTGNMHVKLHLKDTVFIRNNSLLPYLPRRLQAQCLFVSSKSEKQTAILRCELNWISYRHVLYLNNWF